MMKMRSNQRAIRKFAVPGIEEKDLALVRSKHFQFGFSENEFLTPDQVKALYKITDPDQLERSLSEKLGIQGDHYNLKDAALVDFHFGNLWWAKEQRFNYLQALDLAKIGYEMLLQTLQYQEKSPSAVQNSNLVDCIRELSIYVASVITHRQPKFSRSQLNRISSYFTQTFFQHHKLYVYMLKHQQTCEVTRHDITVEVPTAHSDEFAFIGPLDEALPQSIYDLMLPKTPSQLEEEENDETQSLEDGNHKELSLLEQLTWEEIQFVVNLTVKEEMKNLQGEMARKLMSKENDIVSRLNKICNSSNSRMTSRNNMYIV